ncbi:MAG: SGNH/GDSL hydrolase family protein, partial [Opitutae bacterium]|nr:SGNH/GDSL hydrolase family protein [Opitutae bacterium]
MPKAYKWLLLTSLSLAGILGNAQALELKKGAHVVILGNTLAERMQHHGWLETYAQAAFTGQELVFRNHGFSGDRVDNRPRNRGFIDPHTYLEISKADVILTFFGSNAAWDNNPGNYKNALSKWIDDTRTKKYNGKSAPTIVLFSPIAHEDLKSPNFPNGKDQNGRLEQITKVTADVAKEKKVEFVNLFSASQQLFANAKNPLTNNGIFLSNEGNKILSQFIFKSLFGKDAPVKSKHLDKINAAVLDKNWHWFNRYRATDGNDVWGGRSGLRFVEGQSNKDVLWHELSMIDVMTANRDKVVHAAAKGKTTKADDSNVPPPVKVKSNVG